MRPIPLILSALPLIAGCATLGSLPSLGTYYVDEERVLVRGIDEGDTVATLAWGDSLEVLDAPMEVRTSEDLFVVRSGRVYGRTERDALMSDILFRSRYSNGRPIGVLAGGGRYYLDEFGDTVVVRRRTNLVRKPVERDVDVVEQKELLRPKRARGRR
jgi:hypothetical protein